MARDDRLRLALLRMSKSRKDLLTEVYGNNPTYDDVIQIGKFIRALGNVVQRRRRTELRGLGVFEWKPFHGRTPAGNEFNTWRLVMRFRQKHIFTGGHDGERD